MYRVSFPYSLLALKSMPYNVQSFIPILSPCTMYRVSFPYSLLAQFTESHSHTLLALKQMYYLQCTESENETKLSQLPITNVFWSILYTCDLTSIHFPHSRGTAQGEFLWIDHPQEAPVIPHSLPHPSSVDTSSKMVYIWLTTYPLDIAAHMYREAGYMEYEVAYDQVQCFFL